MISTKPHRNENAIQLNAKDSPTLLHKSKIGFENFDLRAQPTNNSPRNNDQPPTSPPTQRSMASGGPPNSGTPSGAGNPPPSPRQLFATAPEEFQRFCQMQAHFNAQNMGYGGQYYGSQQYPNYPNQGLMQRHKPNRSNGQKVTPVPDKYEAVSDDIVWDKAESARYRYEQKYVEETFRKYSKQIWETQYRNLTKNQKIWQVSKWLWDHLCK